MYVFVNMHFFFFIFFNKQKMEFWATASVIKLVLPANYKTDVLS